MTGSRRALTVLATLEGTGDWAVPGSRDVFYGGGPHVKGGSTLRRRRAMVAASVLVGGGVGVVTLVLPATSAFADTQPYELFCPGSPVGTVVINGVITTGTMSPASPAAGQQFNLTNYQTQASILASFVTAAAALGNRALSGTATTQVDATGATPPGIQGGTVHFNMAIPSPVPQSGVTLSLPSPATTIGPFTASGGPVTLTVDPKATLTLQVSGQPLTLACTAYPNDALPSGITTNSPSGSPVSPVITSTSTDGAGGTTATTVPKPVSSPAGSSAPTSTALTGSTTHLWMIALIGSLLLLGGTSLLYAEGSRLLDRRRLRAAGTPVRTGAAPPRLGRGAGRKAPERGPSPASMQPGRPGAPPGLWVRGWEPEAASGTETFWVL